MFEHILLAVDGSDHALKAAGLAGDLADRYGADVLVLHVIEPSQLGPEEEHMAEVEHIAERGRSEYPWVANVPAEMAAMLQPEQSEARREGLLRYLADKVVRASVERLREHGVRPERIRVVIKNGRPARRILETIEEEGSDVVVMGSRGLTGLAGMVEGSVSRSVAAGAPCSVITVK